MTQHELLKNFVNNIEKERTTMGLSQQLMAQKLNISTSGYKKLISGQCQHPNIFIALSMYQITGKFLLELLGIANPKLLLYRKMQKLSTSQLNFINDVVDFELEFAPQNTASFSDYINVLVPTGNLEDGMFWDSANIIKVDVSAYRKRYGSMLHSGIKITSNHLHPVYHVGDILLISKRPPRHGDTAVFVNKEDGRLYFRRFLQCNPCALEPLNGYGEAIYIDPYNETAMSKWIKFGIVLTKMRS